MKKMLAIIVLGSLGLVSSIFASNVTDVALSYADGATVATITVDGSIRFTHEPVEAKEGKPFRVLVDVLAAEHHLVAKDFMSLPKCGIQSIRTSQYSVAPEKIVRLVFDLGKETIYRVSSDSKTIKLYFPRAVPASFDSWLASATVPAARKETKVKLAATVKPAAKQTKMSSVARINKSIEKDRQLSLVSKVETPTKVSPPKPAPPKKWAPQVSVSKKPYGPEFDSKDLAHSDPAPANVSVKKAKAPVSESPKVKMAEPKPAPVKTSTAKKAKSPAKVSVPAKDKPQLSNKAVAPARKTTSPTVAKAPKKKKESKKAVKVASAPAPKSAKAPAPAKVTKKKKDTPTKQRATSRFRRNASGPGKIKGTLVAEFPKRLVIKYKARSRRDPFETLINESKTYDNPIDGRVPNVEGLRLVGIIQSENGENRALFEDTDSYGYILKAGDKVRKGYVLRVEDDRVYFQIFEYGWSRTVALNIDDN